MTGGSYPPSVEIARLYEKTSQRGTRYFVGRLGLAKITLLPGDLAEDGTPVWRMLLQEVLKSQGPTGRPAGNSPRRASRARRQPDGALMADDSVADLWAGTETAGA